MVEGSASPEPAQPPASPRRYWSRRGLAEWLCNELGRDIPTIVGIDHAFSFPLAYFEKYRLSSNWQDFWPFDGCEIPEGKSVVAEGYPALWMRGFQGKGGTAMNKRLMRRRHGCNARTAAAF